MSSTPPPAAHPGAANSTQQAVSSKAAIFLSDLHLSPAIPRTVAAFERTITSIDPDDVGEVYVLGDLFEYWVGDEMLTTPFARQITDCLATLHSRGIRLYVMHGNRDFLLGKRFARAAKAQMLSDPTVIEHNAQRWILTHGDALCTDDLNYQRFRRVARLRAVQCFFLAWPYRWRKNLAGNMRANSEQKGATRMHLSDVTTSAVRQLFQRMRAERMIQGHTHRPARHIDTLDATHPTSHSTVTTRWVLPDWECDTPPFRGGYLRLDQHGASSIDIGIDVVMPAAD